MRIENGKIALASLEYFLTDRCNLRCEHCAASSPYMRDANLPVVAEFERELHCLRRVMTSDQLKLVGGEPLLNRSICEFLRVAVDSDVFKRIRVTTNGLLLSRMSDEFWERTDVVEISRYPGIERPDARELDVLRASGRSMPG